MFSPASSDTTLSCPRCHQVSVVGNVHALRKNYTVLGSISFAFNSDFTDDEDEDDGLVVVIDRDRRSCRSNYLCYFDIPPAPATMGKFAKIQTGLLLFFLFTAPCTTEITYAKIRSDNQQINFHNFEFTKTGHVSIAISSVSVTMPVSSSLSRPVDPSRIGFFLISQYALLVYSLDSITHANWIPNSSHFSLLSKISPRLLILPSTNLTL
ncbi:hypothetical protein L1887_36142 [Cichorium endivia]|nr:hypothetical protein L1887_36142 [Cichorium endivia]